MKKSEILKALTFENASYVKIIVFVPSISLFLEGSFTTINAMRIIYKLPSSFEFQFTPIE